MNNFITFICVSGLAVFIYNSNVDSECKKAKNRLEAVAQAKTINILHTCNIINYACVNNALVYQEEMKELVNTQLKDLGCK